MKNTIQTKDKKENIFLTKKRIILFTISGLIALGLVIFSLIGILKINFHDLFYSISTTTHNKLFAISIIMLIIAPLLRSLQMLLIYLIELKKRKIKLKFNDLFCLVFVYIFIVSITPSSIGGEPWLIYWLRKHNIPLKEASAFVLYSSTISHLSGTIITWPSFIYFLINILPTSPNSLFVVWFCSIGMGMETIVFIVFMILSFSPRIQYWISMIFNKVLKWINLRYKTKQEIQKEFLNNKSFSLIMKKYYKRYLFTTFIFLSGLLANFILYLMYFFAMNIIYAGDINFWDAFNAVNISVTANNFIPLPGSEGSLEVLMKEILKISLPNISLTSINYAIFIWRFSTNYFPALIGLIYLINFIIHQIINKKNSKLNVGNKNNKVLLLQNRAHNTIGGIETYNRYLIKILNNQNYDVYELDFVKTEYVNKNKFVCNQLKCNFINQDSKYYEKTKYFEEIDEVNLLKQFIYMRRFIKYSRKIVKQHLKNNSYDLIIDSSFFGFKFLSKNKNYVWIQHNSKKSHNGMIFNNPIMNFLGFFSTKLLGVYNTFKVNKNVVLFDKYNEIDLKIKNKKFFKIPLCYGSQIQNKTNRNKNKICFIGRLEKDQKRVDLLIKLSKILNQKIYVYGYGPYVDKIKKENNLIYCGKFNPSDIKKVLNDKQLCLILSNHEGFPFTAIEAMCNGTTVLIRNTFPSAKFFTSNNLGLLINKNKNIKYIREQINVFLNRKDLINHQKRILKFSKNNFSFKTFEKNWINVINKVSKKR